MYLKVLGQVESLPCNVTARVSNQPGIIVTGPPRTFLKPKAGLRYIPSGRLDRKKDAPHTVFVRALYIQKEKLQQSVRNTLDAACAQITGSYLISLILCNTHFN